MMANRLIQGFSSRFADAHGSVFRPALHLLEALFGFSLLLSSFTAQAAANTLEGLSFASLPGDRVQIKLSMSGPAVNPLSFTIDNPARIALDFADTSSKLPKAQTIGVGIARSINAIEAKGRTRVVLNLVKLVDYQTSISGNDLVITLGGGVAPVAAAAPPATAAAEAAPAAPPRAIDDVDFRRGEQGEGRIVIKLSDPATQLDLHEEAGQIVVDFLNTALPERLERRLDVVDFATPVQKVDTFAQGNNVRMVIAAAGTFDHLAYQSDKVLTIDVKAISKERQEEIKREKFGYVGERLSLNFQNIEVRSVLQLIADFTGLNMVASDTVTGSLTLRLKNVPWDQALDIILKTKGLAMRQVGNVMLVAPAEEIAAREKLELESKKQVSELAPLHSEFIRVNYAKATDLAALIKAKENSLLTSRGNVAIDERTNTLLVQDTAEKLTEIRRLITTLDVPVRQVLIESRIVIANDDFSKNLGARFGISRSTTSSNKNIGFAGNLTAADEGADGDTTSPSISDRLNVSLPVTAYGQIALAIAKLPFGTLLDLELSALQSENRGEIISSPRVITANQKQALIEQGVEIPYQEASSSGATSVSFKKAVLSLRVTPQITPDDRIIMDLQVNKDSVGELFAGVPSIDTREVATQVLVDNGETVVLGGVYEQTKSNQVDRVPFFGDLPYVGFLFKRTLRENDKSELLIFVTPKLLKESASLR